MIRPGIGGAAVAILLGVVAASAGCSQPGDHPVASGERGVFSGIVVDGAGEPVAGALIEIAPGEGAGRIPGRALRSDHDGLFRSMPLEEGTYVVQPITPGLVYEKQPVSISAAEVAEMRFEPSG